MLCAFKGQEVPCVAEAKPGDPHQYCPPHAAMLFRDYALAFRRRAKTNKTEAERWAITRGFDVEKLSEIAATLTDTTRPLTVRAVSDVDSL